MFRLLFVGLLLLHGAIHSLGVVKAFHWAEVPQLTQAIGKPLGVGWGLAVGLFGAAAVLFWLDKAAWPLLALSGVVLSQALLFTAWPDAKFGTIANVVLLLVALAGLAAGRFERDFRADVRQSLARQERLPAPRLVTEDDLAALPPPVRRYLRYAGVVGRPRVHNARFVFRGEMRERGGDWFAFTSEQYNFYDEPERFFFMTARVKGLPTAGYHRYTAGRAGMQIKVLSLFPVVDLADEALTRGETVTLFNDLCLLAPAALLDPRIAWEAYDASSAVARFTNGPIAISATLHFNAAGELVNFVSPDRYETNTARTLPFSTPLADYRDFGGYRLAGKGDAVWHYPEGPFVYGRFYLQEVDYNVVSPVFSP